MPVAAQNIRIYPATPEDRDQLGRLFECCVRQTCHLHYTPEQLEAWIRRGTDPSRWQELFAAGLQFYIARKDHEETIAGYSSAGADGYIHSLFVHPAEQHRNIGTLLLQTAEEYARRHQTVSAYAEVSLTALPFFEMSGYHRERQQEILLGTEHLTNILMRKSLVQDIQVVPLDKKKYLDLLLLGDEQESMIDRYLERGTLFVLQAEGKPAACCVVTRETADTLELKNIAVAPRYQRQGYGKRLIDYLFSYYKGRFTRMIAGTGESPETLSFYQHCGFVYSHRVYDFFTINYDHPIYEGGIRLTDMVYLVKHTSSLP